MVRHSRKRNSIAGSVGIFLEKYPSMASVLSEQPYVSSTSGKSGTADEGEIAGERPWQGGGSLRRITDHRIPLSQLSSACLELFDTPDSRPTFRKGVISLSSS